MVERECIICGATFTPKTGNQICCSDECAAKRKKDWQTENNRTWKEKTKVQKAKPKKQSICDKYCVGCVFLGYADGAINLCEYFLTTGKRRPCPAGTGCTVKQKGERKKIWSYQNDETWKAKQQRLKNGKTVYHRVCPVCGTEFDTTDSRKIYCNRSCGNKYKWRKYHDTLPVYHRKCKECGAEFDTTDRRKMYCNRACIEKHKNKIYYHRRKWQENGKET